MIFGTIVQDGDANKSRHFSRPSASGCRSWSAADDWVRVRGTIQVYDLAGTRILSHVDGHVHGRKVLSRRGLPDGVLDDQTNRGTRSGDLGYPTIGLGLGGLYRSTTWLGLGYFHM